MKKIVIASIASAAIATVAMANPSTAKCVGCHGAHFEKHALGKSKVVKDMSKADVVHALKGYKHGGYGGPMKGVMKGQIAGYSDADLETIGHNIGK